MVRHCNMLEQSPAEAPTGRELAEPCPPHCNSATTRKRGGLQWRSPPLFAVQNSPAFYLNSFAIPATWRHSPPQKKMMKKREKLLAVMRPLARPACKMVGNLLVGVIRIAAPSVVRKKCVVSLLTEANGGWRKAAWRRKRGNSTLLMMTKNIPTPCT